MTIVRSRRAFLAQQAMGIGSVALAWLMQQQSGYAKPKSVTAQPFNDLKARQPAFEPKARAMISLFQHGGPSHMDLTDPKPELSKFSGTDYSGDIHFSFVNEASKKLLGSPFRFRAHGECGTELSELLPHTSKIVDDMCLIRSMHTGPMVTRYRSGTFMVASLVLLDGHAGFLVGVRTRQRIRGFASLHGAQRSGWFAGRWRDELVQRVHARDVSRYGLATARATYLQLATACAFGRQSAAAEP